MDSLWQRTFTFLALLALAALAVWGIAGATQALLLFSAGLLTLIFYNLRHLAALHRWLQAPEPGPVPSAWGVWDEVFSRLHRLTRSQTRRRQELSTALDRFQQAASALPDGVVILDEQDRIQWCNPVAEAHFGLDRARDIGQQITYLVRMPQFAAYLRAQNYREPMILKMSRDASLTLSAQLIPYGDEQKLLISRDITSLERVETMRRDFVANVSHELRTPLTVVGGFLETLADMDKPDRDMIRRSVELMLEQTRRMQRLVEDLLTLSQLENASNLLREEPVNVPQMLPLLYQEATSLSGGKHRIEHHANADWWVLGSAEELRSAFSNLVSNAVRYTPEGGEIDLAWGVEGGQAVFSVRDTGIGIEARHIPRLTERFYRVDRGRSRETGGTGLGLAIVKHVLNRHQARLEIESAPGKGSLFRVRFPAARSLPPSSSRDEREAAGSEG